MISEKKLSSFSGDLLDWVRCKQAYEDATKHNNVGPVFDALEGDAGEATGTWFAAGNSATKIMQNLETRLGNSSLILEKILVDIRDLRSLESLKRSLADFTMRTKNAVAPIKTLNHKRYLFIPELAESIKKKFPS